MVFAQTYPFMLGFALVPIFTEPLHNK